MYRRLICICLLALAPVAMGQSTASKKELVNRLLALQQPGIEAMARGLAEQPLARLMQAVGQAMQSQVPPEKREASSKLVDAEVRKYLDESVPLLRDRAIKLAPATVGPTLEEKFSEDELRQLVAWLESPVNKKYQQVAPEMQKALVEKLVSENRGAIEPKLKALEDRVAEILGLGPQKPAQAAPAGRPPASAGALRPAAPAASKAKP